MPQPVATLEPESRCVRCGRPTPAGVSLCDVDNPGRIKAPSATQVHGTILVGVILGFVLFGLAARFAVEGSGPFGAVVAVGSVAGDGSVEVVVAVANEGTSEAAATCRVTRDGILRPTDVTFRTPRIPAGGSIDVARTLPPPQPGEPSYDAERLTVSCS